MKKWIEKGKQFLKKFEEDHDKKKKEQKQPAQQENQSATEEQKQESMMSKSLDNDKMYKLGQLLLHSLPLDEKHKNKLQNSQYFRKQTNFISICEQLRKCSHEVDFQSQGFQNILKQNQNQGVEETGTIIEQNPLFLIGVVGFHHKKGSIVEFYHPSNMNGLNEAAKQNILDQLPNYCMPDAIHNKNEDYVYFTLNIKLNSSELNQINSIDSTSTNMQQNEGNQQSQQSSNDSKETMLFGVSYFKQIKVSEKMRQLDKELTRSHLQKSLFVLSTVPLQGYIMGRLEPTTKAYFEQEQISDYDILKCAYDNMNMTLKNNQSIQESEIYIGTSLKTLIHFFKEKTLIIFKALLLQKKILVFSLNSCSTSNFIMSLISLVPGLSFFKFRNKYMDIIQSGLGEYGLPLRLFNEQDCPLELYFTIQNLDDMDKYKGYLIGTTNQLIKSHKKTSAQLTIDLDTNTLLYSSDALKTALSLNSEEKKFIENITKTVNKSISECDKNWKNMEYSQNDSSFIGSNDWIRQQFTKYLIDLLCEIELVKKRYKDFQEEITQRMKNKNNSAKKEENKSNSKTDQKSDIQKNEEKEEKEQINNKQDSVNDVQSQNQQSLSTQDRSNQNLEDMSEQQQKRKISNDEEIMNELFDDFLSFDSDDESETRYGMAKQQQKYAKFNQLDSEALMSLHIDDEMSKTEKIFKQKKKELKISYNTLKKYNLKFLREYFQTENYRYWLQSHDESIYLRSINSTEFSQRSSLSLESGAIYFGSMQNGERNGKGSTFDQIQNKIELCENYENDLKNGRGTITTLKGDYYFEGIFVNDLKEGQGNLITDKQKYCGFFQNDKFMGQGVLVGKDQSLYEGEFSNNMKNGMGKYRSGDSSVNYVGFFQDDLFSDKGQLIKSNGDVYCGDFKKGEMHGQGEYQSQEFSYTGEFFHNKFQGQGIYKNLSTNDIYQGEFHDNQLDPNQHCIIKYSNGDVYSGVVVNWLPNGEGLISYKDGRFVKGIFQNGKLISQTE